LRFFPFHSWRGHGCETGEVAAEKADLLAEGLRGVLDPVEIRMSSPSKCVELRVRVFDARSWRTRSPLQSPRRAVARLRRCSRFPSGLNSIWVRCPVAATRKVALARRLRLEWVSAPVDLLDVCPPPPCFCCLERGHVMARCPGPDRRNLCYR